MSEGDVKFDYSVPPDVVMGCLHRVSKPGAACPFFRERFKVMTLAECDEYIGKVSLENCIKAVFNQGNKGSCATESAAGGVAICRASQGLPFVLFNPWFIYYTTSHGRDQGSSIDENLQFLRERGVAPESVHPRSLGVVRPSEEAYEAAKEFRIEEFFDITTIEEAATALVTGFPFIYGSKGHSVLKYKHTKDGRDSDLNSWGEKWGNRGRGTWATYREINWQYGAFAYRLARQSA